MKTSALAWWLGATTLLLGACDTARTTTDTTSAATATAEATTPGNLSFSREVTQGDYRFAVQSMDAGGQHQVTVRVRRGDALITDPLRLNLRGDVSNAVTGDLNGNGKPELYLFTSGSSGGVEAYELNDRNLTPITSPARPTGEIAFGYKGSDTYELRGNRLVRTYPVYAGTDSATSRMIEYTLDTSGRFMPSNTSAQGGQGTRP